MKKYLLSIAALLLGLLAHSQEADDLGNHAEVSVIARLDLNPFFGKDATEFTLGNSSLYTLFEGSASDHFSWTLANHWFSGNTFLGEEADPWAFFNALGKSNETNFIDLAYVDLTFGNWTFNLGKNCIATGGHEYDDYDWMVHTGLASPLWSCLACYQWGGKVTYTTPSEMSNFSLQMTTSPFGEKPFSSGLWTWSAQWGGEYGWYAPLWSVSLFQSMSPGDPSPKAPVKQNNWLISLGNQFLFNDWTITLDWSNCVDMSDYQFVKGWTLHGVVNYAISDKFDVSLRGNWVVPAADATFQTGDQIIQYDIEPWWNIGAICEFYPLRDSRDLRLHAIAQYDKLQSAFAFNIGILYNLNIKLW